MSARHTTHTSDLTIEFADNTEGEDRRAGMNGVRIRHRLDPQGLFAPELAGLNFEHIFDGQQSDRDLHFEPRRAPCALEPLDDGSGVTLTWPPTPQWGLSAKITLRAAEPDMVDAEYAFTPTRRTSKGDLLGVFFADYINQPAEPGFEFRGREADGGDERVISYASPHHGTESTHRRLNEPEYPPMGEIEAHWMYASLSPYVFTRPYFWGEVHGLTATWMFDPAEGLRMAHSPSGGGRGNPAWDYIFLMPGYEIGRTYRWRSRLVYRQMPASDVAAEVDGLYHAWQRGMLTAD
ncbi:MAG: hypothetical protein JSV65_06290 [Armatimonadota bacterium]|nr:MAG: hypothetical protein JSV65_06290 [Armatimonadota bacterium]